MENEPTSEYRQHENCSQCGAEQEMTRQNTMTYEYTKQPECNNILMLCWECDALTRVFLTENSGTLDYAKSHGFRIETNEYPPEAVYDMWLDVMDIHLIPSQEVSEHQDKEIKFLAYMLEHDLIQPDYFK